MIRDQTGESLIEVLVASIVLSIGILGCLSLQTRSTMFNEQSMSYSMATITHDSITKSVRSNQPHKISTAADFDHLLVFPVTSIEVDFVDNNSYAITVNWKNRNAEGEISNVIYTGKGP